MGNILSASIFSYNDIQPGQIYTRIINKIIINTTINDFKILLSILGMPKISSQKIRCIIPSTQFYDKGYISNYKLSSLTKLYKIGHKIQCMFLTNDDYDIYYMSIKPSFLKLQQTKKFIHRKDLN